MTLLAPDCRHLEMQLTQLRATHARLQVEYRELRAQLDCVTALRKVTDQESDEEDTALHKSLVQYADKRDLAARLRKQNELACKSRRQDSGSYSTPADVIDACKEWMGAAIDLADQLAKQRIGR